MANSLLEPSLGAWEVRETSRGCFIYRYAEEYREPVDSESGLIRYVQWSEWNGGNGRNRRKTIKLAKSVARHHKRRVLPRRWSGLV